MKTLYRLVTRVDENDETRHTLVPIDRLHEGSIEIVMSSFGHPAELVEHEKLFVVKLVADTLEVKPLAGMRYMPPGHKKLRM